MVNRRVLLSSLALLPAWQARTAIAQQTTRGGNSSFSFAVYGDSRSMDRRLVACLLLAQCVIDFCFSPLIPIKCSFCDFALLCSKHKKPSLVTRRSNIQRMKGGI